MSSYRRVDELCVLSADIVNFSKVVNDSARDGVADFISRHLLPYSEEISEVFRELLPGEVLLFKGLGDGLISAFGQASDAVDAAIKIQSISDRHLEGFRDGARSQGVSDPTFSQTDFLSVGVAVVTGRGYLREPRHIERERTNFLGPVEGPALVKASRLASKASREQKIPFSPLIDASTLSGLTERERARFHSIGHYHLNQKSSFVVPVEVRSGPSHGGLDQIYTTATDPLQSLLGQIAGAAERLSAGDFLAAHQELRECRRLADSLILEKDFEQEFRRLDDGIRHFQNFALALRDLET